MPNYSYKCVSCMSSMEKLVPMQEHMLDQECVCGGIAKRMIGPVSFLQRGDSWVGKNVKIKGEMGRKNDRLSAKGRDKLREAPGLTLAPNVNGERVDSWEEASRLAASKGLDAESYRVKASGRVS